MQKRTRFLKERMEAKSGLESYAYNLKRQVEDKEQLGSKISDSDKEKNPGGGR